MNIRKLDTKDIKAVVELWYKTSIIAHDFIPADYWKKRKEVMALTYLPSSETYLAIKNGKIAGFVSMIENFLAAIFVENKSQGIGIGIGIGKNLLNFVKSTRMLIQLQAYKKNRKTIEFYKSQGFKIMSNNKEEKTGEYEFLMKWKQNKTP